MRVPPLKAIEAVKTRRIDGRTRHVAVRFRNYFQCLDAGGVETTNEQEISKIVLTRRAEEYWASAGNKRRIPGQLEQARA